jgi:peptidoglycan hydrolase-like protein with peptidoglycan-binding domain
LKRSKLLLFLLIAVFSLTSAAYADTYKTGNTGKAVESIQQQLKKLGFFTGEITGYFGPQTATAVKRFQANKGLHADGTVGSGTYKYLFSSTGNTTADGTGTKNVMSTKEIQTALKKLGYYTGAVDGVSGSKMTSALQKFQKANKMTADGVVGQATKNKLLSATAVKTTTKTAKTGAAKTAAATTTTAKTTVAKTAAITPTAAAKSESAVEMLDWWSEASKIFKIGTVANITDVKTGKTFKIMRTYGTNHADCEAVSSADTEVIKSIWGGWSWTRRPVIVEVGRRRMAASMAAMPHAGIDSKPANTYVSQRSGGYSRGLNLDKIKNNKMSGHIDVHFLNSKTHGTNKVDSKHQAAIKEAAKY